MNQSCSLKQAKEGIASNMISTPLHATSQKSRSGEVIPRPAAQPMCTLTALFVDIGQHCLLVGRDNLANSINSLRAFPLCWTMDHCCHTVTDPHACMWNLPVTPIASKVKGVAQCSASNGELSHTSETALTASELTVLSVEV